MEQNFSEKIVECYQIAWKCMQSCAFEYSKIISLYLGIYQIATIFGIPADLQKLRFSLI